MDPVNNLGKTYSASPVQKLAAKPIQKELPVAAPSPTRASDRVEISNLSHLLKTLKASGDVRTDKIASIKAEIAGGTYEDDKKLDAAVDKLLDDLLK